MDINEIVASIPNIIASLYENIYVVNKKMNRCYQIDYTGDELKLSVPKAYDEIKKYISIFKENIIDDIDTLVEFNKILSTKEHQEKMVTLVTKGDYKIIMVIDITIINKKNSNKKILLIADDSPIITKFFVKTFMNEYEIIVAKDGKEVISLLDTLKNKPLVGIFLDLQMPNMNGFEVLDYFKEKDLFKEYPVSIISGEDSADGIEKAMKYDVVDMLQKPFSAASAKAIVDKTISFSPKNK